MKHFSRGHTIKPVLTRDFVQVFLLPCLQHVKFSPSTIFRPDLLVHGVKGRIIHLVKTFTSDGFTVRLTRARNGLLSAGSEESRRFRRLS